MADTFAYDLVSFLRVLYQRRLFIIKGTVAMTLLVVIVSLIWPETWRANASVMVSTPKFKETLELVPKNFDVLTYQSIMRSDRIYQEIIETLKWYKESVEELLENPAYQKRIKEHLGEETDNTLTPFGLIQHTNTTILSAYLIPDKYKDDSLWVSRVGWFALLSEKELRTAYDFDLDQLDDISAFDLRKMLHTSVTKVKETNMETVYSNLIEVAGEFDTAPGSKMVTNAWVGLFMLRAEEIVQRDINKYINFALDRAQNLEAQLVTAEEKLMLAKNDAHLDQLRTDVSAQLVLLTGMNPTREQSDQIKRSFNLDDDNTPFMMRRQSQSDATTYQVSNHFEQALLGQRSAIEMQIAIQNNDAHQQQKLDSELLAINAQIDSISQDIKTKLVTIHKSESQLAIAKRQVARALSSISAMQPLVDEALFMQSQDKGFRYADVSASTAIEPDKRVFPRRSVMVLAGMMVAFFLFCGLAFFQDIWVEVTRPEDDLA